MDRDNITRTGAKDPWGREAGAASRTAARGGTAGLDTERGHRVRSGSVRRVEANRATEAGMPGAGLTADAFGKARPDRLAFKPYWGQLAVRNFRGGDGNVGIIRSPLRAIALPNRALHSQRAFPRREPPCQFLLARD